MGFLADKCNDPSQYELNTPFLLYDEDDETILSRTAKGINEGKQNPYEVNWETLYKNRLSGDCWKPRLIAFAILHEVRQVPHRHPECEADELYPPTVENLGNAFTKYGIVQIGGIVVKTGWEGEIRINF